MALGTGTVHGFYARKLLVEAGVDPDDLRLDAYEQVDRAVALVLSGFDSERSELVEGAVTLASDILRRWRAPRPELVAGLVRCLESRHSHARGDAAMVLGRLVSADSTQDITSAVPALIVAADDSYDRVAGPAAWALARLDHPAVLDSVHRWLASSSRLPFFQVTSLGQVLQPLVGCAPELLPAIRRMLVDSADEEGLRPVLTALAAWGSAASEAVPELVSTLATRNVRWACDVLGSIGPAAAPAANTLEGFVRGVTQPPRHDGSTLLPNGIRRWHGAQNAAWAHWRITGESKVFLAFAQDAASQGLGYADLGRLAELGPIAARCMTAVRPLLASPARGPVSRPPTLGGGSPATPTPLSRYCWRRWNLSGRVMPTSPAARRSDTSPTSVPPPPPLHLCWKPRCCPTGASQPTSTLRHVRRWRPSATASPSIDHQFPKATGRTRQ